MNDNDETAMATLKVLIAWIGALVGSITLQQVVLTLTAVYTAVQLYILVRDKIVRHRRDQDTTRGGL